MPPAKTRDWYSREPGIGVVARCSRCDYRGMTNYTGTPRGDYFDENFAENFRRIERAELLDAGDLGNEQIRGFFAWWRSHPLTPPPKSAFDILDHHALMPNFFMMRVHGEETFAFVLAGEEVIRMVGRNHPGRVITVDDADEPLAIFARYLRGVVQTRNCWRCSGDLRVFERGYRSFESIDCPLTDEAGEKITHTIGVMFEL